LLLLLLFILLVLVLRISEIPVQPAFLSKSLVAEMALPKRIIKETERLVADAYVHIYAAVRFPRILLTLYFSVPGINAVPHEDNLRYFDVTIHGPAQSPYEGMSEQKGTVLTCLEL